MPETSRRSITIALVALYIAWGSTYVAFKVAFEGLPPLLSTGTRFAIAGGIVLVATRTRASWRTPNRRELLSATILGCLMVGLGTGLVVVAVKHLTTGTTALAQATVPMWVALGDRVYFGTRLSRRANAGLLVGLIGVVALGGGVSGGSSSLLWIVMVVLGSMGWAIGALVSRVLRVVDEPMAASGLQMVLGGLMLVVAGLVGGDLQRTDLATIRMTSIVAWIYLLFVSALVGFNMYMWLLRKASPTVVATSSYVDPVMALFFGWAVLGERLSVRGAFSAAVIVAGAALIVTAPSASESAAARRGSATRSPRR